MLPEDHRERFKEEWQSHLDETPGKLGKLLVALGFLLAAFRISHSGLQLGERVLSAIVVACFLPVVALVFLVSRVYTDGIRVYREKLQFEDGRTMTMGYLWPTGSPYRLGSELHIALRQSLDEEI